MHRIMCLGLSILLFFSVVGLPTDHVIESNSLFTQNLYTVLSKSNDNVLFSPISLHVALAMIFQGAGGSTVEALAKALQTSSEPQTLAEAYRTITYHLNNIENTSLLLANKLFLQEGAKLTENFQLALQKHFLSKVQKVDFSENILTAKIINDWVKDKTNNKIQNLITSNDLNHSTRLLLVNAIYFKGEWKNKFDKRATHFSSFYQDDAHKTNVSMMYTTAELDFKDDWNLKAHILKLPYTNEDLNMIIILPWRKSCIQDLEEKLTNINLANLTSGMRETEVDLYLPKFRIEQNIDFKDSLTELGLGVIFDEENADFRKILELDKGANLYVSKIVQKVFIEINEDGAEAAAATVEEAMVLSGPRIIKVDQPFIFVLMERNIPLFMGKVMNPTVSPEQNGILSYCIS